MSKLERFPPLTPQVELEPAPVTPAALVVLCATACATTGVVLAGISWVWPVLLEAAWVQELIVGVPQ